jgi:hypothetical protein
VHVKGTGSGEDVGIIRLHFPEFSEENEKLEPIEWDEWFDEFDQRSLALLVEDTTAQGRQSNFNKLINRENAESTRKRPSSSARGKSRRKAA